MLKSKAMFFFLHKLGQPPKNVSFQFVAGRIFFSKSASWHSNNFFYLNSFTLILNMTLAPFVSVLTFFTFILIRVLDFFSSPLYKYAAPAPTFPRIYQTIYQAFRFHFYAEHVCTRQHQPSRGVLKVLKINSQLIKVGLSPSKKMCVICSIESPVKVMRNAFYFILKVLPVLKIYKYLS